MISTLFSFAGEIIESVVDKKKCYFRTTKQITFGTIDNIRLDKAGTIKEFPDLKDNADWQIIARNRFKEKINSFNSEEEIMDYIINDLKKFGYKPLYKTKQGFRPEKL